VTTRKAHSIACTDTLTLVAVEAVQDPGGSVFRINSPGAQALRRLEHEQTETLRRPAALSDHDIENLDRWDELNQSIREALGKWKIRPPPLATIERQPSNHDL
jgi:hypothetical protein